MIESIEIKNFRCFKDTKIAKFGLVNLIGGMNNAGKTALLEAIYLAVSPTPFSLMFLYKNVRKENTEFAKEKPENAWDNLFFQQDNEQEITLDCITNNQSNNNSAVTLRCNKKSDTFINFDFMGKNDFNDEDKNEISSKKSVLHISVNKGSIMASDVLISNWQGITGQYATSNSIFNNANFISSSASVSGSKLASEYDKACFDDKADELLTAFKIIDNTIEKVEVFTIGKPTLYLQRKNEKRMPITLFGDALNKVADFVLRIINNPNSIILIDEIENGIHYTAQAELWEMLFKLAIAYETQIFATSHSFEMMKAFAKVAQEFPDEAAYFELAKHEKTDNIIGSSIPIDVLYYNIKNHAPFRGE